MALSPSGGILWTTTEDVYVDADITSSVNVIEWTWDVQGTTGSPPDNPPNIVVTPDGNVLNVAYVDNSGLFPLQFIRYLMPDGTPVVVQEWDDVPAVALSPEIVAMRAGDTNLLEWQLTANAQTNMGTDTGIYTLRIFSNYSVNRDILIAAVGERS